MHFLPADQIGSSQTVAPFLSDPEWFRTAVFYEVMVQSFADSNGDGIGDLGGLVEQLDYLQWLGVDCIWLLPLFISPLRDGGYDVSDFRAVRPSLGSITDFVRLVEEAHRRGMRVIIDMVINHTSDQHPWFRSSRSDPDGLFGEFYLWADDDSTHTDARIIFIDSETSNWAYDAERGQYYWHRFYSHQPDLDYGTPAVQDAVLDVLRFWLDLGIDGLRLDAVPYLYAQDGTDSENLPQTHAFLKRTRSMIDKEYPGRILLAEANQLPSDAAAYFGDTGSGGDECHMAFHFPLMPRIFLALWQEQHHPISDMIPRIPRIPTGCQWAIFLRNHDELSLEMVTDEERHLLYQAYATEPRMRSNIGIRRRLAPLAGNDPGRLRLLNALLLSLPGSPVLYYGDEIGMGDNIWLPDRDGVRTPMQWDSGPNAGFSAASGRPSIPVIDDPVYGPHRVNVARQRVDPESLLNTVRRLLTVRRQHRALAVGDYIDLASVDPRVLAFARRSQHRDGSQDIVVCLNNLSGEPARADFRLPVPEPAVLVDLWHGGSERVSGRHHVVRLSPYGIRWFSVHAG